MKKKIVFLIGMMCMLWALAGCNGQTTTVANGEKDAKSIINAAYEKLSKVDSYKMNLNMDMVMDMKDVGNMAMNVTADASTIINPKMLMDMTLNMKLNIGEEDQNIEMRQIIDETGNEPVIYQNLFGSWTKLSGNDVNSFGAISQNPEDMMKTYTEYMENVRIVGEKTINNRLCYEIKMNFGEKGISAVEEQMGSLENLTGISENLKDSKEIADLFKEVEMTFYISKENEEFVGIKMEFGEILKKLMVTQGYIEDSIGDAKFELEVIFADYNCVKEIIIPDEAKSIQ